MTVTDLADRGFGDKKLYALLAQLPFDFVIRFRGVVAVERAEGETRSASDWVPANGKMGHTTPVTPFVLGSSEISVGNRIEVQAGTVEVDRGRKVGWVPEGSRFARDAHGLAVQPSATPLAIEC